VSQVPLRIVSRIDIKGPNVIKGVHLEGLRVVGNPADMSRRYYLEGTDEILFMDVVASLYNRNQILNWVEAAASEIFVPMIVGGGVRSVEDVTNILRSGADKVSINTAAVKRPEIISDTARALGSQCVVLSVEVMRRGPSHWEVMTDNGRENTGREVISWAQEAEALGAGEVLVTSIDQEGTKKGFDIELVRKLRDALSVPVIACGGAGNADHVRELVEKTGVDAVCCAAMFHYNLCSIPELKNNLARHGVMVRQ